LADEQLRRLGIGALPIDPFFIAQRHDIMVQAKPTNAEGVSGMLIRAGDRFGIAYTTHIDNAGFQRFSIAHELGHYFLPGHVEAVLREGSVHESRAGFIGKDRYELEADHFAAALLMPGNLFRVALGDAGTGLASIESLAQLCETSLVSTAIRCAQLSKEPLAVVVSTGRTIDYCFMSDLLRETKGIEWIRKFDPVPVGSLTAKLNAQPERVRRAERVKGAATLDDWFGGEEAIPMIEEAVGLGVYGRSLTVLHSIELPDPDEDNEEDALVESWTPRFRR
jgi:Zn-dependent peptidase ImmA (M78 family)